MVKIESRSQLFSKALEEKKVDEQTKLIDAFLDWRLNKPYSDYNTKEYDIKEFLKKYNNDK